MASSSYGSDSHLLKHKSSSDDGSDHHGGGSHGQQYAKIRPLAIRDEALVILTKAVKRLGRDYIPYIQVARQQLKRLSQEHARALKPSDPGYSMPCLERYEATAVAVWYGRDLFDAGDFVEVRF